MASPPRILLPDFPVFITSRVQEGLPLAAKPLVRLIVLSILARAQVLFNIELHHLIIMGNHFHFLLQVLNPEAVVAFMDYFKTETAHAINRLLGRRNRTVWEAGYDSLPILTIDDVVNKIAYIYNNPTKAGLESSIELYPGVSSWKMFKSGRFACTVPYIRRTMIKPITDFSSKKEEQQHYERLLTTAQVTNTFRVNPNGWMRLFGITQQVEIDEINRRIMATVREVECELAKEREKDGKNVVGAERLKALPINTPFKPKKFAQRMWCICSDLALRKLFIQFIKDLITQAKEVTSRWRVGDFSAPFPIGLFPPRLPLLANIRPGAVFEC